MSTCPLNRRKPCKQFRVCEMPKEFIDKALEYENYVLVYSKDLARIYEKDVIADVIDDDSRFEGLVQIRHGSKVVYRKCRAFNRINKDTIGIGYRTLRKLGFEKPNDAESVCVMPANWFCYLWNHNESVVRWPFIIAVFSLGVSILGVIVKYVCKFINCCNF